MDEMTLKEAYDCIYGTKSCINCKYVSDRIQACITKANNVIAAAVEELIASETVYKNKIIEDILELHGDIFTAEELAAKDVNTLERIADGYLESGSVENG